MRKIETIKKNVEKELKTPNEYYDTDMFISDAKSYISAIKQGRMLVNVVHVSLSGMSRRMIFQACIKGKGSYRYRQYSSFFEMLGKRVNKDHEIVVNGCGMDMIFHTNYTIIHQLKRLGFLSKKECSKLSQMTPQYI